jgi:mannose-6-phosphate isomerase-like protein (cupin superfamily)
MSKWLPFVALIGAFVPHWSAAQAPASQAPPAAPRLFAAAGDVTAMIERARKERKPDQANFIQPIVGLRPFNANLEYRAAGVNAPASSHDKDAELFYVVEGSGTLVTGGKLKDERRTNPENLTGTAIDGGTSRKLAKGDWVLVPEKTPHWFTQVEGALVLMSLHLPRTE